MSRELADHLQYYAELGVTGVSRDPKWRTAHSVRRPSADTRAVRTPRAPRSTTRVVRRLLDRHQDSTSVDDCRRCKLCTLGRHQIVFGVGNAEGAPDVRRRGAGRGGRQAGRAVRRPAGQLLTKIIEAIGLSRDQVYIANVIKCRPPGNRNPEPDEVASCEPFLFRQIDVIQPSGDRAARQVRGAVPAADHGSDHAPARAHVRVPRRHADSDLSPRLPAAQPLRQAGSVGGHEEGPLDSPTPKHVAPGIMQITQLGDRTTSLKRPRDLVTNRACVIL